MKNLSLTFLWHLHQPLYRLRGVGACFHPWVRLHAIRSYYDMVRVLEEFPEMRVTVNLVPVLVEQIRDYESGAGDLFLSLAAVPAEELDETQRIFLFENFFSARADRMIAPLPRFADLLRRRENARRFRGPAQAWKEFSSADFRDLQALFDLAWFGFKAREDYPEIGAMVRKGMGFRQEEIRRIHEIEREILRKVLPLYRDAAARGSIEISTSPYAHPILPLILDSDAAREAMPGAPLPPRFRQQADARAQVQDALAAIERELGVRPRGMWPSEGSLSQETAELLGSCGVAWAAGDEEVLARSDRSGRALPAGENAGAPPEEAPPAEIAWAWNAGSTAGKVALLFRDRGLSDRIGFTYSGMSARRAVADFTEAVEERASRAKGEPVLLLVALDGENPWESYPQAGAGFLRGLYGALLKSARVSCATVSEALRAVPRRGEIRRLHAGSWIRGDFGTWIGGPEKNHAWTVLGRVRSDLSTLLEDPRTDGERRASAWASLRAAEGSDWFWWLDGQFENPYRLQFDQVFRGHLRQACEALGRPAPDFLSWPIPQAASADRDAGLAEPLVWLSPGVDGFEGDFFEWEGAETIPWSRLTPTSTQQRSRALLESARFGFSREGAFLLRLDPPTGAGLSYFARARVNLSFKGVGESTRRIDIELDETGGLREARAGSGAAEEPIGAPVFAAAARKILEMAIGSAETGLEPGERAVLRIRITLGEETVTLREFRFRVPTFTSRARNWSVL